MHAMQNARTHFKYNSIVTTDEKSITNISLVPGTPCLRGSCCVWTGPYTHSHQRGKGGRQRARGGGDDHILWPE